MPLNRPPACSVLIDFLISNETCFLLYFLRLLKYIAKHNPKKRLLDTADPRMKVSSCKIVGRNYYNQLITGS